MKINTNIVLFFCMLMMMAAGRWYVNENHQEQALHPMTSEIAVEPDMMMRNAHHYIKAYQNTTAIKYIENAIRSMKLIEMGADSVGALLIEKAIIDLQSVETELREQSVNIDHLNHAFVNALNSLAYAQLRMAENYRVQGDKNNSIYAMGYAMDHLQNALQFSEENGVEDEMNLSESIFELMDDQSLSDDEVIARLDDLIEEIGNVLPY